MMVRVEVKVGVPDAGLKECEASSGNPSKLNDIGWAVPEARITDTVKVADFPAFTDRDSGVALMAKLKGGGAAPTEKGNEAMLLALFGSLY